MVIASPDHTTPRLLFAVPLHPLQGDRFQPTGFPDLGAATYSVPAETSDGSEQCLLVESAQSVANRLEIVCWEEVAGDLVAPLRGMPYVREVSVDGSLYTSSILEAHRLNSTYLLTATTENGETLRARLRRELNVQDGEPVSRMPLVRWCMAHDPNSILHGLFLAQKDISGGRLRLQRSLSGFIEAREVVPAYSGGVKNDRITAKGESKEGTGNIIFQREEFTARGITAYFNLDLALLRSYQFSSDPAVQGVAVQFFLTLALWKIRHFLESGLRLRTACDLTTSRDPEGLPAAEELDAAIQESIRVCREATLFPAEPILTLRRPS